MPQKEKVAEKGESEKKESRKVREYSFPTLPPGSPFARGHRMTAAKVAWEKYACQYMGLKGVLGTY